MVIFSGKRNAKGLTSLMATVRTYLRTENHFEDTAPLRTVYSVKCVSLMLTDLRYHLRRPIQSQSIIPAET
jgi:hypothetical protein